MQLGNGKWESTSFNPRLQPTQIALGTVQNGFDKLKLNYTYSTTPNSTDNNGNVLSQTITVPTVGVNNGFTATQTYTYDSLNRLKSATENIGTQTWKQTFLYDRYGNRNFDTTNNNTTTLGSCATNVCNPTVSVSNNRFTSGQGYTYDLSGNVITDAQGRTFAFDAENKQKEVRDVNNVIVGQYLYDGDGKRVKKVSNTETVIFVYDAQGKLVAEYANQIPVNPQVSYLTADNLGSPRITTDANGNVISRRDFLPFGEEIQRANYGQDNIREKFATYERDSETELDFAQARYYTKNLGRFNSVDPIMLSDEHKGNPQRWNAYIYVLNCPTTAIDPDGKRPKRIIDVFLAVETSKEDRAKFDKLRRNAPKGVKINIYTMEKKNATAENFIKSIQAKGRTTILISHAMTSNESENKMTRTGRYSGAAVGRFSDSSIISTQDNVEKGDATDTVDGTYTQAKNIVVFACDFGATFDKLGSTNNTNFLSLDNGKDGFSSIRAGLDAGLAVTKVIANGGNAGQAEEAAQKVLDNSSNKYDKGDKVNRRVLNPVEIEVP